jgi:hypothetical protein
MAKRYLFALANSNIKKAPQRAGLAVTRRGHWRIPALLASMSIRPRFSLRPIAKTKDPEKVGDGVAQVCSAVVGLACMM